MKLQLPIILCAIYVSIVSAASLKHKLNLGQGLNPCPSRWVGNPFSCSQALCDNSLECTNNGYYGFCCVTTCGGRNCYYVSHEAGATKKFDRPGLENGSIPTLIENEDSITSSTDMESDDEDEEFSTSSSEY